jgi:hypothetical protein
MVMVLSYGKHLAQALSITSNILAEYFLINRVFQNIVQNYVNESVLQLQEK